MILANLQNVVWVKLSVMVLVVIITLNIAPQVTHMVLCVASQEKEFVMGYVVKDIAKVILKQENV